jgi:hypothetical protein
MSLTSWSPKSSYLRPVGGTAVGERTCQIRKGVGRSGKSALSRYIAGFDAARHETCAACGDEGDREAGEDEQRERDCVHVPGVRGIERLLEEPVVGLCLGRLRLLRAAPCEEAGVPA